MLDKALELAAAAHAGKRNKRNREPYILHPVRVMASLEGDAERICAVLHDVLEDSHITIEDLRLAGIDSEVIAAVEALTKNSPDEAYDQYTERICRNELACTVKLADLKDNMDLSRIPAPTAEDFARVQKYSLAHEKISQAVQQFKNARATDTRPKPLVHRLQVAGCGITVGEVTHNEFYVSIGAAIVNPNTGFVARDVHVVVAFLDEGGYLLGLLESSLHAVHSGTVYYYGDEARLDEGFHSFWVTAWAGKLVPQDECDKGVTVTAEKLQFRCKENGRARLTGFLQNGEVSPSASVLPSFVFYHDGAIVGGCKLWPRGPFAPGEVAPFVEDLHVGMPVTSIMATLAPNHDYTMPIGNKGAVKRKTMG